MEQRSQSNSVLPISFIHRCKQRKRLKKIADSTGAELTGGSLLMRTLILRRLLLANVLQDDEKYVGVLLPPSNGGVITNAALAIDKRVAVNLNYTVTSDVMNACIRQAGIKHVLTSQKVMDKMNLELDADVVMLEDLRPKLTLGMKVASAWEAFVKSGDSLVRKLGLDSINPDDILTLIFTSGSTGEPKGVMLTHSNILSNVNAINDCVHLNREDVLVGILPFFHSFGFTVTLWTALGLDVGGAYHFSPLDGKQVGKLTGKHRGTVLLATPTFLRTYIRKCSKEEFAHLDVIVTGAEKLPTEVADAFEQKFGVRPVEGYGATELSPLATVNVPPTRSSSADTTLDVREGSVGRPVVGVTAKVVHLDTGEEQPANESGMLLIKGPNVMKGYFGRDDLTEKVIRDGWYVTGDVAFIDEDGFVHITGRQSRFSKIGGEMVPHIQIEEALSELIGDVEEGELKVAVTAVPHPKKGEQLVVVHTEIKQTPEELMNGLREKGLPSIYIPAADCFHQVDEIPVLGTGKLDLRGVKEQAQSFHPS